MYAPLLLGIFCLGVGVRLHKSSSYVILPACCLAGVAILWFLNYINQRGDQEPGFDEKRVWFFLHGFVLSGVAGIMAATERERFLRVFPWAFAAMSLVTSVAYMANYDPSKSFYRLLEDDGLNAGIHGSWGASACLYLLFDIWGKTSGARRSAAALLLPCALLNITAALLSGTRGALISFGFSLILLVCIARRKVLRLAFITVAMLILVGGLYVTDLLPEMTIARLSRVREKGLDDRQDVQATALRMLAANPRGKVFGYESSELSLAYCHNTFLQMLLEAGLLSLPCLGLLVCSAGRNLWMLRSIPETRFLIVVGANVFLESCSAGTGYDGTFWLFLFFGASLLRPAERWATLLREMPKPGFVAVNHCQR
jgi:O-antigen ligase